MARSALVLLCHVDNTVSIIDEIKQWLLVGQRLVSFSVLAPFLHHVSSKAIHNEAPTNDNQAKNIRDSQTLVLGHERESECLGWVKESLTGEERERKRTTLPSGTMRVMAYGV